MLSPTRTGMEKKPTSFVVVPLPALGTYTCTPGTNEALSDPITIPDNWITRLRDWAWAESEVKSITPTSALTIKQNPIFRLTFRITVRTSNIRISLLTPYKKLTRAGYRLWEKSPSRERSYNCAGSKKGYLRSEEHTSELQSRENLVCR